MSRRIFITLVFFLSGGLAFAAPNPSSWEKWKTDFSKIIVPSYEIQSGGPPKDGIPSIDNPIFVSFPDVADLAENEPVIGISINDDARAYPLSVLMWHEIANDVVGGKPVVVTYCPLCNAAIVFDAMHKGQVLDFGTTGRLRHSDLLMYDRKTESWWQQFSGRAIIGDYVGDRLNMIPSRLESFGDFKKRFPNGKVLVPEDKNIRRYGKNPYVGYDTLDKPFLFNGNLPHGIRPMDRVIIVRKPDDAPFIMSMKKLRESKSHSHDGFNLSWHEGQASALDASEISDGREIGNVVVTDAKTGQDVVYDVTFAFVAFAFHPDVEILQ